MNPTSSRRIRVYLIDDHPVVRSGIARTLNEQSDLEVIGQSATATDALREVGALAPDVVLVDLALPDKDGPGLITALKEAAPTSKLLVVSGYADEYRVAEALRAGACGYITKATAIDEIVAGIRTAANGGTPLSHGLADVVMRLVHRSGKQRSGTIEALTARELQVLRLFATGLSTREVAASLGISPKTVETHRIRMYDKLNCKSVVDLTRIAVRTGLVEA